MSVPYYRMRTPSQYALVEDPPSSQVADVAFGLLVFLAGAGAMRIFTESNSEPSTAWAAIMSFFTPAAGAASGQGRRRRR
jgi:hypothetical protein